MPAAAAVAATTTRRLWLVPDGRVNKRFEKKNNADNGGIVPASWPRGFVATRSDATRDGDERGDQEAGKSP